MVPYPAQQPSSIDLTSSSCDEKEEEKEDDDEGDDEEEGDEKEYDEEDDDCAQQPYNIDIMSSSSSNFNFKNIFVNFLFDFWGNSTPLWIWFTSQSTKITAIIVVTRQPSTMISSSSETSWWNLMAFLCEFL